MTVSGVLHVLVYALIAAYMAAFGVFFGMWLVEGWKYDTFNEWRSARAARRES